MSVGANLKARREESGMTQAELAKVVCTSRVVIAQYENGYKLPSLAALVRIADALGTTPAALLEAGPASGAAKEARA